MSTVQRNSSTMQRAGTVHRSGTLHRSGTRKGPPNTASVATKKKKTYDDAQHGMIEVGALEDNKGVPDVDVVFVPGLGANPEDCWKGANPLYSWIDHKEGLRKDFPKARFLLFRYQSAWIGALKVKQTIGAIADSLLGALGSVRQNKHKRPIVFVGHSMGGLVIAKAITLADSKKEKYPKILEAITGCIFFGTPFRGAAVAQAAALFAWLGEKYGVATTSKLLDLMQPDNGELQELVHEMVRLCNKLGSEMFCFYEEKPTDFGEVNGLGLFGLSKALIPKKYAEFVTPESATLQGVEFRGLACNHRELVKFDGPRDQIWLQCVREPVKRIIQGAPLAIKGRLKSNLHIDLDLVKDINKELEGGQAHKKRKNLNQTFAPSSWIPDAPEYRQWLGLRESETASGESGDDNGDETQPKLAIGDCIWIRGREGRGKTNATMAALKGIESCIQSDTEEDSILLAYFFCDTQTDYCTAEDVLKSIILQLIDQQGALAPYAKVFTKKKSKTDASSTQQSTSGQAQVTIENLWQALLDMLADEFIGSRVYIVLNNLHVLHPEADSTVKLMRFLKDEVENILGGEARHVRTRWLITSREVHNLQEALDIPGVRLIDLEDSKYEGQVQLELRRHARSKIEALKGEKKYNQALAYFASSLIGKRAQNTQWIDITCVQLAELGPQESDLRVRKVLETMPEDLNQLLTRNWQLLFAPNDGDVEKMQEILRALVLTYEDPTEAELGLLAGFSSSDDDRAELRRLVNICKPLLRTGRSSRNESTVSFLNIVVKTHLRENAKQLLGLSKEETKWQHGVLALRCFEHLKDVFGYPEAELDKTAEADNVSEHSDDEDEAATEAEDNADDDAEDNGSQTSEDEDGDDEDAASEVASEADSWTSEDESDDNEDGHNDPEVEEVRTKGLTYAVKHWLHHASKATLEIAEDLSLEESFWEADSRIRRRWLIVYCLNTSDFSDYDRTTLSGLHVAAAIGFRDLVEALIRNGHRDEITKRDSLVNSPLHFAAALGRPKIVEELLKQKAPIDDGAEEKEPTPLHMAAWGGHTEVMKKLISRGADANAWGDGIGPVVNAAISSGNRAAVELLVEHGVPLHMEENDNEDIQAPLAWAASISDASMFSYLLERYADKLPPLEYSKALVSAADSGRMEVFQKLFEFHHTQEYYQRALDTAAREWNWDIVMVLFERCNDLNCDYAFNEAATCSEPQDRILHGAWKHTNGGVSKEALEKSLYEATDYEKESTVRLLLDEFHVSPNANGEEYGNALTAAAYDGNKTLLQILLDAGADVNSAEGWALQTAATEGHYDIVEVLLEHGADVNACTSNDNFEAGTALQGACEASKTDIVKLLLDRGANPDEGAGTYSRPIVAACTQGDSEILELLLAAKAEVNVFGGSEHSTPLINAARYMPDSSLRLLLDAGADINLANNDGDTALTVASWGGYEETVEFLLDNGANILHVNVEGKNALQIAVEEEEWSCVGILSERLSVLLGAIKAAMDSGNAAVTRVVRSAVTSKQELDYGDAHSEVDTPGVETPQVETARAVVISSTPTSASGNSPSKRASIVEQPAYDARENQGQSSYFPPREPQPVVQNTQQQTAGPDTMAHELEQALGHQIALYNQLSSSRQSTPPLAPASQSQPALQHKPSWESREPEVLSWEQNQNHMARKPLSNSRTPASEHEIVERPETPPALHNQQSVFSSPSHHYQYETDVASSIQPSPLPQEAIPIQAYNAYQQSPAQQPQTSLYNGTELGGQYNQGHGQFAAYQPSTAGYDGSGYPPSPLPPQSQPVPTQQQQQQQQQPPPPPPPPQQQPQHQQPQQQQQQQQPQVQAYQPSQWYQPYTEDAYYNEQHPQTYQPQPQLQPQYDGGYMPPSQQWSQQSGNTAAQYQQQQPQRPEIKPQRSSFFGVSKNTFTKAMGGKPSW